LPAEGTWAFEDLPWGAQYLRDTQRYQWKSTFKPFVEFRPLPWRSETINITEDCLRVTPHNDPAGPDTLAIYAFGGSTMLGVGAPDWGTIPAYLSLECKNRGLRHEVVNYASCWWTSSQSLAQLIVLLREEKRPKCVVFYDGINEVNVVSFGGDVGGISPEAQWALNRGFENKPRLMEGLLAHSTFLRYLLNKVRPARSVKGLGPFAMSEAEMDKGAEDIVHAYENNARAVVALGREYGFTPFLFFQPAPMIARKPTVENDVRVTDPRRHAREGEVQLFSKVYALIRASETLRNCPGFFNLEDVFASEQRPVYCDSEHLLPEGNEVIAKAMFEKIMAALGSPK
jgi:hypothetical protein